MQDPDDLPFQRGEVLTLVRKDEAQWWTVSNQYGRAGLVPVTYIEEVRHTSLAKQSWQLLFHFYCSPSISEIIRRRRSALFGHVTKLPQDVPAHKALHCHVDLSLGRPPNDQWKRCPLRPRERWIDQVRKDNGIPRRTCGGVRLLVVTEEQRYGPRWLRDNDDDDDSVAVKTNGYRVHIRLYLCFIKC